VLVTVPHRGSILRAHAAEKTTRKGSAGQIFLRHPRPLVQMWVKAEAQSNMPRSTLLPQQYKARGRRRYHPEHLGAAGRHRVLTDVNDKRSWRRVAWSQPPPHTRWHWHWPPLHKGSRRWWTHARGFWRSTLVCHGWDRVDHRMHHPRLRECPIHTDHADEPGPQSQTRRDRWGGNLRRKLSDRSKHCRLPPRTTCRDRSSQYLWECS
jgi:hypothetical protein